MINCKRLLIAVVASSLVAAVPADATIPVVDVAAVRQLIQDAVSWQHQLQAMQSQLAQLQQTRTALTGARGMEQLLRQTVADRNYLPADWTSLESLAHGSTSGNSALASRVVALLKANARLTEADLAGLAPDARAMIVSAREVASTTEALSQLAYEKSSSRFSALGQLIDRIGTAGDAKAIADLQGRIAAEQAMLANESVKLQTLAYSTEATRVSAEVARREAVIRGHGNFSTRFQPAPPTP